MALHPLIRKICEEHGAPKARPPEPARGFPTTFVWYRGWECIYDGDADFWGAEPWRAAKGGWDLDCLHTSGRTWTDLLDEIDAEEFECADCPMANPADCMLANHCPHRDGEKSARHPLNRMETNSGRD